MGGRVVGRRFSIPGRARQVTVYLEQLSQDRDTMGDLRLFRLQRATTTSVSRLLLFPVRPLPAGVTAEDVGQAPSPVPAEPLDQ